ncbi:SH3 domain protein [Candidatus Hepatincolaceae symbiont of Richtersius coronifer]
MELPVEIGNFKGRGVITCFLKPLFKTIKVALLLALSYFFIGIAKSSEKITVYKVKTLPNVTNLMLKPRYWINKLSNPDKIIMTLSEINDFNYNNIYKRSVRLVDLLNHKNLLSKDELTALILTWPIPQKGSTPEYLNGKLINPVKYYKRIETQRNLKGVKDSNRVLYGFVINRAAVLSFPTTDRIFSHPKDNEFSTLIGTTLTIAQPVRILHTSANKKWYYVQSRDYIGWILAEAVAIAEKEEWENYYKQTHLTKDIYKEEASLTHPDLELELNMKFPLEAFEAPSQTKVPTNSLVITANELRLGLNPYIPELSNLIIPMGTALPLVETDEELINNQSVTGNYVVSIPTRSKEGKVIFKKALIPYNADVNEGFLPYTLKNVIELAFKIKGQRYGWGGDFGGRDCTSTLQDIYKVFGIHLARNSGDQLRSWGQITHFYSTDSQIMRENKLLQLQPGSLLYFKGHAMLYLGYEKQDKIINFYAIHNISSYGAGPSSDSSIALGRGILNEVVVSSLEIPRRNGISFLTSLEAGVEITPVLE